MNAPSSLRLSFKLSDLVPGAAGRVRQVQLGGHDLHWLQALGIFEGQTLTLLRRAPFGGPLHVRTASGGELAIDRQLAREISLEPVAEPSLGALP